MLTPVRIITLVFGVLSLFLSEAQPAAKVPRVGVLLLGSGKEPGIQAFLKV
jgi:hypothetical protein